MLDRDKPYGPITGPWGVVGYVQDGVRFNTDGTPVEPPQAQQQAEPAKPKRGRRAA